MELRPYQTQAIAAVRELYMSGAKRVLVVAPTGSGKTVIFADIVQRASLRGSRCLILAHRRELISQASNKLLVAGVQHGIIQAGSPLALHRPVQVASVQTLLRRPDALSRVDLVVVDECHHVAQGNTYSKTLERFPQAKVLGVTATPWRLDGQGLADVFDQHVIAATPRQLRDEGFLVPVGGWEYEGIDTDGARVRAGDFVQADLQASATSRRVVGDIVAEWLMYSAGRRTVLFATTIAHSQLMVDEFRRAGVPAEHVDGEMASSERDAVLSRLRSGETLVICNCNVLTEGFDCPELEVCILARPTMSTSLYLQMVGRVLRPAQGKSMARLHDHAGCLTAHGHPFAERDYSPELSSNVDRKSSGNQPAQKKCPACKSVIPMWPCDACGFSPTPHELKMEYEAAAAKKEIVTDGDPGNQKKESDQQRAMKWARRYQNDKSFSSRFYFFQKMIERHGLAKAARVYRWASGFTDKPKSEWFEHAGAA